MSGVANALCALNKLSKVDQVFFIICGVIIALIIAVYFLIPVFNKKFYQEQRDNLHKREAAFKSNLKSGQAVVTEEEQKTEETAPEESEVSEDK